MVQYRLEGESWKDVFWQIRALNITIHIYGIPPDESVLTLHVAPGFMQFWTEHYIPGMLRRTILRRENTTFLLSAAVTLHWFSWSTAKPS